MQHAAHVSFCLPFGSLGIAKCELHRPERCPVQVIDHTVALDGLNQGLARWGGDQAGNENVEVEAGSIGEFNMVVAVPGDAIVAPSTSVDLIFSAVEPDQNGATVTEDIRFLAPTN